jgi:pimeloyl-ACP methyl ester carboxylesterase
MAVTSNGRHAQINGLNLYYETHGSGEPLILLHGGFGYTGMFGEIMGRLSDGRQVIAVDLQGHGRTADIDRPMNFDSLSDDVAGLIRHLGFEKADVMGYSFGGVVALRTGIRHPQPVRRLVVVSTQFRRSGMHSDVLAQTDQQTRPEAAESMKNTPMYKIYSEIAPRPQDWARFVYKMGELMRKDYDWSDDVAKLRMPVLIVIGDSDVIKPSHAVEFFGLLGGGKEDAGWEGSKMVSSSLCIIPSMTHYAIFSSPEMSSVVTKFLDEPSKNR